MTKAISLIFVTIIFLGCDQITNRSEKKPDNKKDRLLKTYRKDGTLKTEINIKNGKKNGIAKSYYKNGKLRQEVNYINNVKHGMVKTYYESGKLYQSTPYTNGKIEGIRKKYKQTGALVAEVPYHADSPCEGLKEYLLNGDLKKMYPEIVVTPIDNLLKGGEYTLRITISDNSKNVTFYVGELDEMGCLKGGIMNLQPQNPGVLEIKYQLGPGMFIMEELHFIAVVKTKLGNPFVTTKHYNLAIENRGF